MSAPRRRLFLAASKRPWQALPIVLTLRVNFDRDSGRFLPTRGEIS
jgi:hypothetical protein